MVTCRPFLAMDVSPVQGNFASNGTRALRMHELKMTSLFISGHSEARSRACLLGCLIN